jgi:hypothetical protein
MTQFPAGALFTGFSCAGLAVLEQRRRGRSHRAGVGNPSPVSLGPGAGAAELHACFNREGYVFIRGFLSPAEVENARRNLERFVATIVPTMTPAQAFYDVKGEPSSLKQIQEMHTHDAYFKELFDTRLKSVAEACLGGAVEGKNLQYFNKVSDSHSTQITTHKSQHTNPQHTVLQTPAAGCDRSPA